MWIEPATEHGASSKASINQAFTFEKPWKPTKAEQKGSPTRQSNIHFFHTKNWSNYSDHHTGDWTNAFKKAHELTQASLARRDSFLWKCRVASLSFLCFFNQSTTDTGFVSYTIASSPAAPFFFFKLQRHLFDLILKNQRPTGQRSNVAGAGRSLIPSGTAVAFGTSVTT